MLRGRKIQLDGTILSLLTCTSLALLFITLCVLLGNPYHLGA